MVAGPNGAGKTNLLEAVYFGCTGALAAAPRTSASWCAAAATGWRGWCSTWPARTATHRIEVGFQPGEAEAPARRRQRRWSACRPSSVAAARERVPPGAAGAGEGRARRCAALTSTSSWRRCGPAAPRRASAYSRALAQRNALVARIRAGAAAPAASTPGTPSWRAHGVRLMEDRARGGGRAGRPPFAAPGGAARASRAMRSCATGRARDATDADGLAAELRRAARRRPRARLHRARAAPRRAPAAARRRRRCARTARRASSAPPCWRCCSPSATCLPSGAAARR